MIHFLYISLLVIGGGWDFSQFIISRCFLIVFRVGVNELSDVFVGCLPFFPFLKRCHLAYGIPESNIVNNLLGVDTTWTRWFSRLFGERTSPWVWALFQLWS